MLCWVVNISNQSTVSFVFYTHQKKNFLRKTRLELRIKFLYIKRTEISSAMRAP